jgi:hypothetical protein
LKLVEAGFAELARRWRPIPERFDAAGVDLDEIQSAFRLTFYKVASKFGRLVKPATAKQYRK